MKKGLSTSSMGSPHPARNFMIVWVILSAFSLEQLATVSNSNIFLLLELASVPDPLLLAVVPIDILEEPSTGVKNWLAATPMMLEKGSTPFAMALSFRLLELDVSAMDRLMAGLHA
jgi:hypothetical protein